MYREISPINYITKDSPPLLMIQGDKDTTVPVYHAHYIYMKQRAEELGAPVDILIVKNAGHNFRRMDTGKMNTIITTRTGSIITAAGTYLYTERGTCQMDLKT